MSVQSFENDTNAGLVLVDFWAEWCPQCMSFMPQLESLSAEIGDKAKIMKVNVSNESDLANKFKVTSLPTFMIFKDGSVVDVVRGVPSKFELKKRVLSFI